MWWLQNWKYIDSCAFCCIVLAKKLAFKRKRKLHYNEFQAVRLRQMMRGDDDDEEDDDEAEADDELRDEDRFRKGDSSCTITIQSDQDLSRMDTNDCDEHF